VSPAEAAPGDPGNPREDDDGGAPAPPVRRRVYLLRHGAVSYFGDDGRPFRPDLVPLTPAGREQARATGRLLAPITFDRVIITSGLPRTVETAELVLAESAGGPAPAIESWPDLAELRPGRLSDIPRAELATAFLGVFDPSEGLDRAWMGGETIRSLLARVGAALDRLLDGLPGPECAVLAVLHGGVNRAILSHALTGGSVFLGGLEQLPACVNILDLADLGAATAGPRWAWTVRAVNVVPTDPAQQAIGRSTTMEDLLGEYLRLRFAKGD
jgi:broad specificity phosphatase PhoE